jgi:FkbM family methyltransferase
LITHRRVSRRGAPWIRRVLWKWLHRLPEMDLQVTTAHGTFCVSNKDHGVGRILFVHREYELPTILKSLVLLDQLAGRRILRRRLMIDVGANIGTVCITMVRSGAFAEALAFEPEPRNFGLLVKNVQANGLAASIRCFNMALSSSNGVGAIELSRNNSGDHRLRAGIPLDPRGRYNETARETMVVAVRRLDDVTTEAGLDPRDVGLLWMDVQGAEKHVLEGAGRLVKVGVPVIAEFWPYGLARAGVSPAGYAEYIAANFDCFYDLAETAPVARSSVTISNLFESYAECKQFTDLLLLRSAKSAAQDPRGPEGTK